MPADAREFLADLLLGKARPTDRRALRYERPAWVERAIMAAYWQAKELGMSDEAARQLVADAEPFRRFDATAPVTENTVKHTVNQLKGILPLELWKRAGRPNWLD